MNTTVGINKRNNKNDIARGIDIIANSINGLTCPMVVVCSIKTKIKI